MFIQHGNDNERGALAAQIKQASDHHGFNMKVTLPADPDEWHDLEVEEEPEEIERRKLELQRKIQSIEAELALLVRS